ncbi:uncharacterized protein hhla1 isoform X1 [Oryzias latipes]
MAGSLRFQHHPRLALLTTLSAVSLLFFFSRAFRLQHEAGRQRRHSPDPTDTLAEHIDPDAIDLTSLVNTLINSSQTGSQQLFSLLSIMSYSSLALHKLTLLVYNISSVRGVDSGVFKRRFCYCVTNQTNDLTDFTAVLLDVMGNSTSHLQELFKSSSFLSVSQRNDSDCIYICVMAGKTGRDIPDLWRDGSITPLFNQTIVESPQTVTNISSLELPGEWNQQLTSLSHSPPSGMSSTPASSDASTVTLEQKSVTTNEVTARRSPTTFVPQTPTTRRQETPRTTRRFSTPSVETKTSASHPRTTTAGSSDTNPRQWSSFSFSSSSSIAPGSTPATSSQLTSEPHTPGPGPSLVTAAARTAVQQTSAAAAAVATRFPPVQSTATSTASRRSTGRRTTASSTLVQTEEAASTVTLEQKSVTTNEVTARRSPTTFVPQTPTTRRQETPRTTGRFSTPSVETKTSASHPRTTTAGSSDTNPRQWSSFSFSSSSSIAPGSTPATSSQLTSEPHTPGPGPSLVTAAARTAVQQTSAAAAAVATRFPPVQSTATSTASRRSTGRRTTASSTLVQTEEAASTVTLEQKSVTTNEVTARRSPTTFVPQTPTTRRQETPRTTGKFSTPSVETKTSASHPRTTTAGSSDTNPQRWSSSSSSAAPGPRSTPATSSQLTSEPHTPGPGPSLVTAAARTAVQQTSAAAAAVATRFPPVQSTATSKASRRSTGRRTTASSTLVQTEEAGCPWRRPAPNGSTQPGSTTVVSAHKLQPCIFELCKFFSQCLCSQRTRTKRICSDSHLWYEQHTAEVCRRVRRISFSRNLKQRCLTKMCSKL